MARALDPYCDMLLVGTHSPWYSMAWTGPPASILILAIRHGSGDATAAKRALVVIDLPAGSYEISPAQALESASRIVTETGADAIKLEGEPTLLHMSNGL